MGKEKVIVTKKEDLWSIVSPYDREFVTFARRHGAKWDADEKSWNFKVNGEVKEKIEKKLYELYKYTKNEVRNIKLRAKCEDILQDECLKVGEYTLAFRKYRDEPVIIADPTTFIEKGTFKDKGGSMKYPAVTFTDGAEITFEISEEYFNSLPEEEKEKFVVVSKDEVDKEKLLAEKEELLKRIEEIERLLKEQ